MIAVVDYGIGNLRSAEKALLHVGADARLVTSPGDLADADAVVLPGVGAFGACADALRKAGFDEPLQEFAQSKKPFLGVCVGYQLMFSSSEESASAHGLALVPGVVRRLRGDEKLPQMQWNTVTPARSQVRMMSGLSDNAWFYFVHSFAPLPEDLVASDIALTSEYGCTYVAAIERDNIWGTQFHPEKSGTVGLSVLRNFVQFTAECKAKDQGDLT